MAELNVNLLGLQKQLTYYRMKLISVAPSLEADEEQTGEQTALSLEASASLPLTS